MTLHYARQAPYTMLLYGCLIMSFRALLCQKDSSIPLSKLCCTPNLTEELEHYTTPGYFLHSCSFHELHSLAHSIYWSFTTTESVYMALSPLTSIASKHFHKFIHLGKGSIFPIPDKPDAKGCTTNDEDENGISFLTHDNDNDVEGSDDTDALDHFNDTPSPEVPEDSVAGDMLLFNNIMLFCDMLMYWEFCISMKDGDVRRTFEVIKVLFTWFFHHFLDLIDSSDSGFEYGSLASEQATMVVNCCIKHLIFGSTLLRK